MSFAAKPSFNRIGTHLAYLATGFLVYFLIFFKVLVLQQGTLVRGFDGSVQSFAWLSQVTRGWRALEPPLWDFNSFSGTSFIGEFQTGVLYPGNILLAWLTPSLTQHVLDIYLFVHYVLAFYFMILFLRSKRLGRVPALVGAYAFASYLDWSQPHRFVGMVYLPLVLLFFEKSMTGKRPILRDSWMYLCGFFLGLMILAGHSQPYLHSVIALVFFVVLVHARSRYSLFKACVRLAGVGIVSALFSAPQWLLALEHFSSSYRWAPGKTPGLGRVPYEVYGFVDVLQPALREYFLEGWMPWAAAAAIFALFLTSGRERRVLLFALLLGTFSLLASLGDRGLITRVTWHIPLLNTAREGERYIFLILFSSALLLAMDLQILWRFIDSKLSTWKEDQGGIPARRATLLLRVAVLVGAVSWLEFDSMTFLKAQSNQEALSPVRYYRRNAIIDFLERETKEEGKTFRVLNYKQCLPENLGNAYSVLTLRGHRATINAPYYNYFRDAIGQPLSPKLDRLGVKYLVSPEPVEGLRLIMRASGLYLYDRPNALPVFRLYDPATGLRSALDIERIQWAQNAVQLTLKAPVRGTLVFAQPSFPGWEGEVDGRKSELVEVGIFMGLRLQGSEVTIRFAYRPPLFWIGLLCMVLPLLGLAVASRIRREGAQGEANPG
ncbi:MAG: hypothetical protein ACE5JX_06635 [Acidobacteriota bacterium]